MSGPTSRGTLSICIIKGIQLVCKEIIAVFCEDHWKHVKTLWKSAEFLHVRVALCNVITGL